MTKKRHHFVMASSAQCLAVSLAQTGHVTLACTLTLVKKDRIAAKLEWKVAKKGTRNDDQSVRQHTTHAIVRRMATLVTREKITQMKKTLKKVRPQVRSLLCALGWKGHRRAKTKGAIQQHEIYCQIPPFCPPSVVPSTAGVKNEV